MELKGLWIDKETGKIRAGGKYKLFGGSLFQPYPLQEIILTRQEAKEKGMDFAKCPKGFYTKIDGIRIPINLENGDN